MENKIDDFINVVMTNSRYGSVVRKQKIGNVGMATLCLLEKKKFNTSTAIGNEFYPHAQNPSGSISVTLRRLIADGLVVENRSSEDRRVKFLAITVKGISVFNNFKKHLINFNPDEG